MTPGPGPLRLVAATTGAEQTRALARALAPLCAPGDVLLLAGDLGAGKTTFAQGFGAGLGITEPMTSPTFTLVRQYPVGPRSAGPPEGGVRTLLHADVYRLGNLQEIADLGLGEQVEDEGVALVEWGDVAEPVLGRGSLSVRLALADDDDYRRVITFTAPEGPWSERGAALRAALGQWLVDG